MRDLDGDKELRGRSSESRLSNGGCLGFALDYGSYHVSGIREREKGKGKRERRDSMELRERS